MTGFWRAMFDVLEKVRIMPLDPLLDSFPKFYLQSLYFIHV